MHGRHISDAELAQFAIDPDSLPAEHRQAIEQEVSECAECRTSVDFFSVISAEDLLELEPATPSDDDPMLAYLRRIAEEDEEADEVIAQEGLFASPMKTAWMNLERNKRMLNGGVVRRLVAHAHSICEDGPRPALTFADAAIWIAEVLPDDTYPWKAIFELRGAAWKERANALLVAGELPLALDALTNAERAYRQLTFGAVGLSSVALVRASVLCEQELLSEAAECAERAERGFAYLGQEERRMSAVFLRGTIQLEARDVEAAVRLYDQVLEYGEAVNGQQWIARASYAIGNCEVDRGNLGAASMHFHKALVIFRQVGPERDRLATEWGLARVVLHGGDQMEAIRRFRLIANELEKRSMIADAALVRLDLVEVLLVLGESRQIAAITARLFQIFKAAGMMTGALTALAYMKDAAMTGSLTTAGVHAVRTYLRRVERRPNLLFIRPDDPFR